MPLDLSSGSSPLVLSATMSIQAAPAYGPSALGGDARRFLELTLTLARTEFKLRYFGSVLGYLWSLVRPLLFFGVLYFVFTAIFGIGKSVPHYGVYLLTGIVLWTYLAEATSGCVQCLVQREALLRKVRFPRMVIPLSVSLTSMFNLAMNFIAVLVFALADGVTPKLSWLWLIPIVLGFAVLATGLGMLLSALFVRFRDISPIWDVMVQAWFYLSPVMYPASKYGLLASKYGISPEAVKHIALLNPAAVLLTQMGHGFIGGDAYPDAAFVAGSGVTVAIAVALIPAVFALGWWVFTREAPRVAENL
jgi:ABC-2 type transport system permease protein